MANWWNRLWQRVAESSRAEGTLPSESKVVQETELDRISFLQRAAAKRRAEYAAVEAQAALTGYVGVSDDLLSSRNRMRDAETAHMTALQAWQNKESRQRCW